MDELLASGSLGQSDNSVKPRSPRWSGVERQPFCARMVVGIIQGDESGGRDYFSVLRIYLVMLSSGFCSTLWSWRSTRVLEMKRAIGTVRSRSRCSRSRGECVRHLGKGAHVFAMATYLVLIQFTERGVKNIQDSPKRASNSTAMAMKFSAVPRSKSGGVSPLRQRTDWFQCFTVCQTEPFLFHSVRSLEAVHA